ncbi:MAG: iron ABC transporter permease [Thermoplasmata archaeon]|nr:iron ABC transporter permease [Thermoplasmata archaeon]
MNLGRRALNFVSGRSVSKAWYAFIILFFLLIVLLPTLYVMSYAFTGWDDIQTQVFGNKKTTNLYWEKNNDQDFVGYEVHFSTTSGFAPNSSTLVLTIDTKGGDVSLEKARSSTFTMVSGIPAGDRYYARIRVVDSSGLWTDSNQLSDNMDAQYTSPEPVELLSLWVQGDNVTVNWTVSEDDDFDSYEVYASNDSQFVPGSATLVDTITNHTENSTVVTVALNEVHYFRVRVVEDSGLWTGSNLKGIGVGVDDPVDDSSPAPMVLTRSFSREVLSQITGALTLSFVVAIIATLIDLAVGLPIAWVLVRKEFRGKSYVNTLIDMPLAIPTAAMGFSAALFWGITPGIDKPWGAISFTNSAFVLLLLLQIVFSFPYMVRSLAAILEEIDINYEVAARACGASRLTAARTVTLPLFRSGIVTGAILCLAKTLSETGGVMAALSTIQSREYNATALIGTMKSASLFNDALVPALAFVSIVLIVLSIILLIIVKIIVTRVKLPMRKVWTNLEKKLSKGAFPKLKDAGAFFFLTFVVLIPAFFIFGFVATAEPSQTADWGAFWSSLGLSFAIAGVVTTIVLLLGIPMGILIARSRKKKAAGILDVLVNIPFIVPTAALGFSLGLFWTTQPFLPVTADVFLIIMAHVAFTYPFVVRNVVGALESLDTTYEDTARTLGAKPLQVFKRVMFPMMKASVLAGAIMTFTRSLGETGATLAVSPKAITAPVYIVELIRTGSYYQAGLASILLIMVSFIIVLVMRRLTTRGGA